MVSERSIHGQLVPLLLEHGEGTSWQKKMHAGIEVVQLMQSGNAGGGDSRSQHGNLYYFSDNIIF